MELKYLRCFIAIAETGGFRSASRRLGMEQSIVAGGSRPWRTASASPSQRQSGVATLPQWCTDELT